MTAPTRAPYRPRHAAVALPQPRPQVDEPRRLRVVPAGELSPRARRRRNRVIACGVSLLMCAGLFGVVAFHVVLTQGQLDLDRLHTEADDLQARYDRNRLLTAELESPERIVKVAQERLGMVPPPDVTYLSPTGIKVVAPGATTAKTAKTGSTGDREPAPDEATATSWPTVKAHLAGSR